ncbi:MAG TPA: hypothetical protein VEC11_05020 [Allosphingosinicella sp.]|nr:hypothetical protein [Allosphingosinicella sp.]
MILSLTLAAALAADAAPPPLLRMENARVIAVGPRPPDSGIFASYADMDVAPPGGRPQRMYMLWASRHQYLPDVGSVCRIVYRREPLLPGNLHRPPGHGQPDRAPFNVVYELNCGFAPGAPPVQRNPSA